MSPLTGIKLCLFDAYGTLFDFASAAANAASVPADRRSALTTLWRDKQIQYTFLRTLQGRHVEFETVTGDALDFALEAMGLASGERRDELMRLYLTLSAFPEVPDVLARLRAAGLKTAILSNGSPAMLESAIAAAGLAPLLDRALSVESVGAFKTHPKVYQFALDEFGVAADEVVFMSSNGWDAWAASDFGFSVVWCNRSGAPRERLPGQPDFEVKSLEELPALLGDCAV